MPGAIVEDHSRLIGAVRMSLIEPHKVASPYSVDSPFPPWVWMAWSNAAMPASAAANFAMLAASPARGSPWSCSHAARCVIRRARSAFIFASAKGCATPWCVPIRADDVDALVHPHEVLVPR